MAAQAEVVAQIGDWAVCEDAQGEFYYNAATGQSFDAPPPEFLQVIQAAKAQTQQTVPNAQPAPPPQQSEAKVLQTFGEWAICQDAQGKFYQNLRTKESYDQPPPELAMALQQSQPMAAPAAPPQPQTETKVLQQIGEWAICQDAQGLFYQNLRTKQSYDEPPPELATQMQQSQPTKAAPPQPQTEAKVLQQIGDWAICQDAQGQFYQNLRTKQSYDEAPLELLALVQGKQQRPAQAQQQYRPQQQAQQQYRPQQQYQVQAKATSYQPQAASYQPPTQTYQSQQQVRPQSYAYQSQAPQQYPYQQQVGYQQQAPMYSNGGGQYRQF
jgi:hypothetical protein